jgi:membrane peptidoglycan carboxypeptidase
VRIDFPRTGKTGWRRFVPSWRQWLLLVAVGMFLLIGGFVFLYIRTPIPAPNDVALAQSTVVYYADGKTEIGQFAAVNRQSVSLAEVPVDVQHAVVAAEDRSFYTNRGFSPTGIVRAAWNDLRGGDLQGGSTITQQYAKNAYLTQGRTITRKVKEFILAIKLDRTLSKDQILENYLNTIYFGRGAYGIQAAAQAYFGVDASQLTTEQGAVLAAVIRSPGLYDPQYGKDNQQRLEARWQYVIDGMVAGGWLTQAEADAMKMPRVPPPSDRQALGGQRGYLMEYVHAELVGLGFSEADIDSGGLRVITTFSRKAEASAVKAVKDGFPTIDTNGVQVGIASVEPGTGAIRAMYGGRNYLKRQLNNALAEQQPGSTFKAFTLAAGFENGVTLADQFAGNSPYIIPGTTVPVNNEFNQSYGSHVSLLEATEKSINTAFVNLAVDIGPDKALGAATAAGIPSDAPGLIATPSVTLGVASVSPLQMADAYATFAAQGQQADAYSVAEVRGDNGGLLYRKRVTQADAFTASIANEVTYALTQVVQNGTGTAAQALGRPAAGKTGTHDDGSHVVTAWFVGYTPQLSTAVMFYREGPGGSQASLDGVGGLPTFFGGGYPTQIWTAYMTGALAGQPVESFPPATGIVTPSPKPSKTSPTSTTSPTPTPTGTSPTPTPTGTSPTPTTTDTSPTPTPTTTSSTPGPSP